jgi:hypothetical protein
MSLITRQAKGSKLTIAEMDGNLEYLESNGFVDGEYSRTIQGTGEIIGSFNAEFPNFPTITTSFLETGATGSYTVSPSGGSGTGAEFELTITDTGRGLIIDGANSSVTNGGIDYEIDDELTVPCSELGGTTGEVTITLGEGAVSVTTTSTVTVTGPNITISTPSLTVSGSIVITDTLQANNISGTNISGQTLSVDTGGPSLSISVFGLQLSDLPESDPDFPGSVWNDSGSLRISTGSGLLPPP